MAFALKSKSPTHWLAMLLFLGCASSCTQGVEFPTESAYNGTTLRQVTDWSLGGISGVMYTRPDEKPELASLQLGIVVSRDHATGVELHDWVMAQYRASPTAQWHESTTSDEACKVGLIDGPRPFVAVHVCRSVAGVSACAEADELLESAIVGRCLNSSSSCWDEVCYQMWQNHRDLLEVEVIAILETL